MWQNPQFPADLVTLTKEILNGTLHFLCSTKETSTITNKFLKKVELNFGG